MKKQKQKANSVHVDHRNIVGIDIGKRKHAATAVTPKGTVVVSLKSFENNRTGVDLLERQILIPATGKSKPRIAMEATGQYWNALHDELQRRGDPCVALNPTQTGNHSKKTFAKIYERHVNRYKGHRFSMIVVAHKLARVIWRLVKDGRSFTK